MNRKKGCY